MGKENTELDASNILQLEANSKLVAIEQNTEATLLETSKVNDSIKGMEPVLEAIALNTSDNLKLNKLLADLLVEMKKPETPGEQLTPVLEAIALNTSGNINFNKLLTELLVEVKKPNESIERLEPVLKAIALNTSSNINFNTLLAEIKKPDEITVILELDD